MLILWSVLLFSYHSYHSHRTLPLNREVTTVFRVVIVGTAVLATLAYLLPLRQLSRAWFILFVGLCLLLLLLEKIALRVAPAKAVECRAQGQEQLRGASKIAPPMRLRCLAECEPDLGHHGGLRRQGIRRRNRL